MSEAQVARRLTCIATLTLSLPFSLCLLSSTARAQLPALTPDQIGLRMQQASDHSAAALRSYESRRTMTLDYKGILVKERSTEIVDVTYTAPNQKKFTVVSSSGSPLIRTDVFQREIDSEQEATAHGDNRITPANYNLRLVGQQHLPQGDCYVLEVSPRHRDRYSFEGKAWVDAADFAVVRLAAKPTDSPSFWLKGTAFQTDFAKVDGFWLPIRMTSTAHIRFGGDAVLTIDYGTYRIAPTAP